MDAAVLVAVVRQPCEATRARRLIYASVIVAPRPGGELDCDAVRKATIARLAICILSLAWKGLFPSGPLQKELLLASFAIGREAVREACPGGGLNRRRSGAH
jgi:hypothetical protein